MHISLWPYTRTQCHIDTLSHITTHFTTQTAATAPHIHIRQWPRTHTHYHIDTLHHITTHFTTQTAATAPHMPRENQGAGIAHAQRRGPPAPAEQAGVQNSVNNTIIK